MCARSNLPSTPKPTSPPEPSPQSVFRIRSTNLATYILAAAKLQFLGAQLAANGKDVDLLFDDPENVGPILQSRFSSGAVEMVNAKLFCDLRSFLLEEIKRIQVKAGVDHGNSH